MAARSVLPAIVVLSLMLTREAFALSNPCDDGMGGDQVGWSRRVARVLVLPAKHPRTVVVDVVDVFMTLIPMIRRKADRL